MTLSEFAQGRPVLKSRPNVVIKTSAPKRAVVLFLGDYWQMKRVLDIVICTACLPLLCAIILLLMIANPFANRGPLFFFQSRMGRDCQPFRMIKFRTMLPGAVRGAEEAVEAHRITPLGRILRRTRLDEAPQIINVLMGDMSLIGPRPDIYEHGLAYLKTVPRYRRRHAVRPGITGLAQVTVGYAEGSDTTEKKVRKDLIYIRRTNWWLEANILLRTALIMASGFGSK